MTYDWKAALVFFGALVALTALARFLAFRVPSLAHMRRLNREADKPKLAKPRFKEAVKQSSRVGLGTNLVFYLAFLPFCVTLDTPPAWEFALQVVAVLMLFDFLYYLLFWIHSYLNI